MQKNQMSFTFEIHTEDDDKLTNGELDNAKKRLSKLLDQFLRQTKYDIPAYIQEELPNAVLVDIKIIE